VQGSGTISAETPDVLNAKRATMTARANRTTSPV
jgi:hypothetical protein